jgi:hypothetical protein
MIVILDIFLKIVNCVELFENELYRFVGHVKPSVRPHDTIILWYVFLTSSLFLSYLFRRFSSVQSLSNHLLSNFIVLGIILHCFLIVEVCFELFDHKLLSFTFTLDNSDNRAPMDRKFRYWGTLRWVKAYGSFKVKSRNVLLKVIIRSDVCVQHERS